MATLLLIDDDQTVVQSLVGALEHEGHQILTALDGAIGLELATECKPDLVITELVMSQLNGFSFCREFRRQSDAPVLVLSSLQDELYRIASFELGANDFVAKPFYMGELMARVRNLLRWHGKTDAQHTSAPTQPSLLEVGSLRIDTLRRQVWRDGQQLELTLKEFELLVYLMQNDEIALSRDQLMDSVWTDSYSSGPRTVDVHIHSLREKIEDIPSTPSLIQTVRGVGYRFHMPPRTRSVNASVSSSGD